MKNIVSSLIIICPLLAIGQTATENYVQSTKFRVETTTGSGIANDNKIETITYYDGLGRPIQKKAKQGGGSRQDIITPIVYDGFGRQPKEYLPYADASQTSNQNLDFEDPATLLSDLDAYYVSKYPDDINGGSPNPYSEKEFEPSPLNRVLKQAAPGEDWAMGSGHEIGFEYRANASDEVRNYTVSLTVSNANNVYTYVPALNLDTSQSNNYGYYNADELTKLITKDENHDGTSTKNHTTEEFKDKQGRVILKRTYTDSDFNGNGVIETGESQVQHDTYYIYDDYGNLTYVLTPEMEPSTETFATVNGNLDDLGYQYKYDDRNRLVEKKIPGKGWEYIVYNKLDQPVLTQDAMMRAANNPDLTTDQWLFTKYDAFGRVAYTGTMESNSSRTAHQDAANSTNELYVTRNTSSSINLGGATLYYNNVAFPTTGIDELYTVNYYDDYGHLPSYAGQTWSFGVPITTETDGLLVGSEERVLGTSTWNKTRFYYDDKGQMIRSNLDYYNGAQYYDHTRYTFTGIADAVNRYFRKHSTEDYRYVLERPSFDFMDRPTTLSDYLRYGQNADLAYEASEVLSQSEYDELGQLKRKRIGNETGAPLQWEDYTYNVRGWLKGINDVDNIDADNSATSNDLFAFDINYNNVANGGTPLFNGNISETEWKTKSIDPTTLETEIKRAYVYDYDALNRIVKGTYKKASGVNQNNYYNLNQADYDRNGNIRHLKRSGVNDSHVYLSNMDNLTYSYDGNQLTDVAESGDHYNGFADKTNTQTGDYTYDANGNLKTDATKGITSITYNHLNLPEEIIFNNNSTTKIDYLYGATGTKLKKTVTEGGNTTTIEYLGDVVYKNDEMEYIANPEGYAELDPNSNTYEYVYQYKDHLGNIRLSYKGDYYYYAEDRFDSGTGGWTAFGTGASIANDADKLKVTMTSMDTGAEKNVTVPVGERIKLSLNLLLGTTSAAKVNFTVTEFDANNNQLTNRVFDNRWSIFNIQFTTVGTRVRIRAQKQTDDGQQTYFHIDDYEVKKLTGNTIVEEDNYYPFGLEHTGYNNNMTSTNLALKKKFGGKELQDDDVNGNSLEWYDFGARDYDAALGRWMNLDPLAEKMRRHSPYNYAFDNPVFFIDPDGMDAVAPQFNPDDFKKKPLIGEGSSNITAPIYDTKGNFLGTDNEGLQGKAIVMNSKNFTQGMSHKDALSNSLGVKGLVNAEASSKLLSHYNGLKDRPDYDGIVTRSEGIAWAKAHPGAIDNYTPDNMLYIDASKLDFGDLNVSDFVTVGDKEPQNLLSIANMVGSLTNEKLESTVYALGRVYMVLNNINTRNVSIFNDYNQNSDRATDYDWNRGGSSLRRYLIDRERKKYGLNDSHGFRVYYYGTGTLRKPISH